jgi:3-oxoadipate enol-lactonase
MRPDRATRSLMVAQARAARSFAADAEARRLTCPVLCMAGTEDTLVPAADVAATAALIPHAEYAEIEAAGHSPLLESPAAFERVLAFLAASAR